MSAIYYQTDKNVLTNKAAIVYNQINNTGGVQMSEPRKQQSPNKVINIIKALTFIRANSPVDVATISDQTGIALPTLYRAIKSLADCRIIVEDGKETSLAGRKAQLYSINYNYTYVLGIILEKNYVKAFIAGMDGQIRNEQEIDLKNNFTREQIIECFEAAIDQVLARTFPDGNGMERIERIGILSSSAIDVSVGKITDFAGREALNDFAIVPYVQEKYQKPVKLMKVSAVEALSYSDAMRMQGVEQYMYVHIGQGVGACLVVDGKLYEGKHGAAGEIEYLFETVANARNVNTSTFTAWHVYDLVSAFVKENPRSVLAQLIAKNTGKYGSKQSVIRHSVDEAIAVRDKDCIALLAEIVQKWADIIWILSLCYDPEVCIIGGDISERVPNLFGWIRDLVKNKSHHIFYPADAQMTNDMALAKSVLDDSFIEIQKQISSS